VLLLLLLLHDLVLLVLEGDEVLVLLLHELVRLRRRRVEHGVVVALRHDRHASDGLGALLRERVAEGPVRDEAVPPACNAMQRND
jgi:hypothetical protein